MPRRITVPRALADWIRQAPSLLEAESRDPAILRKLQLKQQVASYIVGLTSGRAIIALDPESARTVIALAGQAAGDEKLSDAGKAAILQAGRVIAREFGLVE